MVELDEIRSHALQLPGVEEGTHFRLPAFKVHDKAFVVMQRGDAALVSVDQATATAAAAGDPDVCEEVWRNDGAIFVGLRVDLAACEPERITELVEQAWRNKAPRRVVAAYDGAA